MHLRHLVEEGAWPRCAPSLGPRRGSHPFGKLVTAGPFSDPRESTYDAHARLPGFRLIGEAEYERLNRTIQQQNEWLGNYMREARDAQAYNRKVTQQNEDWQHYCARAKRKNEQLVPQRRPQHHRRPQAELAKLTHEKDAIVESLNCRIQAHALAFLNKTNGNNVYTFIDTKPKRAERTPAGR